MGLKILYITFIAANLPITGVEGHHPVLAVRAEMPVQLAGQEGVPLFLGERVLPRGCLSVQQVLRHAPLRSQRDVAVTTASASPPCVLIPSPGSLVESQP